MALVRFTRRPARTTFPGFVPAVPSLDEVEARMRKFFEGNAVAPFEGDLLSPTIGWTPPMEIIESPDALTLTAELPGMDRKDVDLSVDDGVLTLSGEKTTEHKEGDEKECLLWERSYGSFRRSFTLPRTVDASKISAEFEQGILKVTMPKTGEAKIKGRKIEIAAKKA